MEHSNEQLTYEEALRELEELRALKKVYEKKLFLESSVADFLEIMHRRENQDLCSWSEHFLGEIAPFCKAISASLYVVKESEQTLELTAAYAVPKEYLIKSFVFGEGTIGQAAKTQRRKLITKEKHNFSLKFWGLNEVVPELILVLPLIHNTKSYGVLEMIFANEPEHKYLDLLQELSNTIAANLAELISEDKIASSLRQSRQSQTQFESIIHNAAIAMLLLDASGNVILANNAFTKLLGISYQELLHLNFSQLPLRITDNVVAENSNLKGLLSGKIYENIEAEIHRSDSVLTCLMSISNYPILDKEERNYIVQLQDISDITAARFEAESKENFMKTLFDTIPSPVFYRNSEGFFEYCNNEFTELLFHTSKENVIGKKREDFIGILTEETVQERNALDSILIATKQPQRFEGKMKFANGSEKTVLRHKSPVINHKTGDVVGIIGIIVDISESVQTKENLQEAVEKLQRQEQEAREREEYINAIFQGAVDAIFILNEHGKIVKVNSTALNLFVFSEEELIGCSIDKLMTDESRLDDDFFIGNSFQKWLINFNESGYKEIISQKLYAKDGRIFDTEISFSSFEFQETVYYAAFVRDVTEQRKLEAKVKEQSLMLTQKLEREVAERTKDLLAERSKLIEAKAELEEYNKKISSSINYAKRIQLALLPEWKNMMRHLPDSFIFFKSKDVVSGDFYYFYANENLIFIAAVDCTGHGVPGAFMSMLGMNILNQIIEGEKIHSPEKILNKLHEKIREDLKQDVTDVKDGMDAAFCVIDTETKTVTFAGANNPLVYVRGGVQYVIKGDKMSIGGYRKNQNAGFTKHVVAADKPTSFYVFTDGFQDQFGGEEYTKFYGKRFRELLLEISELPMPVQRQELQKVFFEWKGDNEQTDDILVMGFRPFL